MKHINSRLFCSEKSCRTFPSFCFSFDSHSSSLLCYPSLFLEELLQLFPLLLMVMAGHMPHVSAVWQLSLGRVVFSSQYRGGESVISPISFSFSSAVFTQARVRLRRESCSSVGPHGDDRQQFRGAGTLSLLHLCCEIPLTESAQWALLRALHLIFFF